MLRKLNSHTWKKLWKSDVCELNDNFVFQTFWFQSVHEPNTKTDFWKKFVTSSWSELPRYRNFWPSHQHTRFFRLKPGQKNTFTFRNREGQFLFAKFFAQHIILMHTISCCPSKSSAKMASLIFVSFPSCIIGIFHTFQNYWVVDSNFILTSF